MKTVVLGAGIIGTTTAYFLAKLGHEVHVIDRQPAVAMETSFANGGVLHTSEAEPWSRPGMPRKVLSWMGKKDAPMLLHASAIPSMWRWGLDFIRNCTLERYRQSAAINLRLSFHSLDCIRAIREDADIDYDMAQRGSMKIYTNAEALAQNTEECRLLERHGMQFEVVEPDRCVELEPALAPIRNTLVGALYFPPDEHGDCRKFALGLQRHCEEKLGVKFDLGNEIGKFVVSGDRVDVVNTRSGPVKADNYVVALASFAPQKLAPLGIKLSIYPAKGVTVTVPADAWPEGPKMPIIDDTRLFGLIRIGDRYRCSGSVEFAGWDATPSIERGKAIVENVISVFPEFRGCYDEKDALIWSGLRPMAPSGNPYLGATPIKNLFLNCGHGHLGWTMSCGSGQVVADIVAHKRPAIDMHGLSLDTHF